MILANSAVCPEASLQAWLAEIPEVVLEDLEAAVVAAADLEVVEVDLEVVEMVMVKVMERAMGMEMETETGMMGKEMETMMAGEMGTVEMDRALAMVRSEARRQTAQQGMDFPLHWLWSYS